MTGWSRRDVLRALASSAAAPALAPLAAACGAPQRAGPRPDELGARPWSDVQAQLAELVAELARRTGARASAAASLHARARALVNGDGSRVNDDFAAGAVFRVAGRDGARESATADLTADGLARAARALAGDRAAPRRAGAAAALGETRSRAGSEAAAALARALYGKARRRGGSRIVYRGAYAVIDRVRAAYVNERGGARFAQRRGRSGVVFVAAAGAAAYADAAERASADAGGLDLPAEQLDAAAEAALALLVARPAPLGDHEVLLDPGMVALLVSRCVAPALQSDAWTAGASPAAARMGAAVGSARVTIADNPTAAGAFARYAFDDEGVRARATPLLEGGVLRSPLCDRAGAAALGVRPTGNGRRPEPTAPAAPRASHLRVAPGERTRDELIASLESGMLLEGALAAGCDLARWRATVRAARCREVKGGKLTGRLYGPVALHADVPALLASVRDASDERAARAVGDGWMAQSIEAPAWIARGLVTGG